MKQLFAAAFLLTAALAAPAQDKAPKSFAVKTSASFGCGEGAADCTFLLYTNDCKEGTGPRGNRALICTHELIEQFTLKPGESRAFPSLPPGFDQCIATGPGKPEFPACVRRQ